MISESRKKNRETSPFTVATNNIKCPVVTPLYDKNFNSLKIEIEEGIRKWKGLPYS